MNVLLNDRVVVSFLCLLFPCFPFGQVCVFAALTKIPEKSNSREEGVSDQDLRILPTMEGWCYGKIARQLVILS